MCKKKKNPFSYIYSMFHQSASFNILVRKKKLNDKEKKKLTYSRSFFFPNHINIFPKYIVPQKSCVPPIVFIHLYVQMILNEIYKFIYSCSNFLFAAFWHFWVFSASTIHTCITYKINLTICVLNYKF